MPVTARLFLSARESRRYQGDGLVYAGKTGTGFMAESARQLRDLLNPLVQDKSPLTDKIKKPHALWVKPDFCAEMYYTEVTSDGRPRHASCKGYYVGPKRYSFYLSKAVKMPVGGTCTASSVSASLSHRGDVSCSAKTHWQSPSSFDHNTPRRSNDLRDLVFALRSTSWETGPATCPTR